MIDFSKQPYYDDYDPKKGYTRILAVPGRVEQAREFTQAQTMMADYMGRLGDSMYSNGTIIDGCSIVINGKQVTISSGRVYVNGLVRLVDGGVLNITGTGNEYIGVKVVQSVVTETEDGSLRDPAQNYENYGQAGAHRIKEVVKLTLNDNEAPTIYTLNNGTLLKTEGASEEESRIYETLARRTYDENGSYKVNGLELMDRKESNSSGILVSITQGKAYVKGYEVTKQTSTTVALDFALDTRQVLNEPIYYKTGTESYKLNNYPVKELTRVTSVVQVTETITRGNITGGTDFLTHTPVVSILTVSAGGTTYTQGKDYQLSNDGVDWSLSGSEPNIGTTYTATYTYNKNMVIGTDVELSHYDENGQRSSRIRFKGSSTPVNSSTTLVDYNFYLSRKDLITMDKSGAFNVFKGESDIDRLVESPINQDDTQLTIGTVLISAGYTSPSASTYGWNNIKLSTYDTTRLSQANLYNLKKRVDDLEYNVALSDLDNEAADGESPTQLRGIFTDGFIGVSKSDTTNPDFNCCIDTDNEELTLPITTTIDRITANTSTYETNISKIGTVYMAPFVHELALRQPYATKNFLVNPYAVYNPLSIVQLSPSVDNWIDKDNMTVEENKITSTTLRRWWYHRGASWAESEKVKWQQITGTTGEQLAWSNYDKTSTSTTSQIILDEAVMYMRQIEVNVSGSNYMPNSDNIQCYFNDTQVPLTPTGSTQKGTLNGTVRADASGRFTAKFTVVKNTPCGSVNVVLKNNQSTGTAVYSAEGRKQIIQNTVLKTRVVVNTNDPLAQSFSFAKDTILTKVALYFAAKDNNKNIVVQLRDMQNGYPGTTVYDEVVVNSSDVKVSTDASVATEVAFTQPVYCKSDTQYCVCILSDSNVYEMWVANLGETDIKTKSPVTSQPYATGVMFSSSNALTWTAHQTSDIKFDLYRAKYTGKGVIVFNQVTTDQINRLLVAAQSVDYKNNGMNWFFRYTTNGTWLPLDTYVDRELPQVSTTIQLKCEMNVSNSTSPILAGDSINLVGFLEKSTGTYISKTATFDRAYNNVTVSLEANAPTSTGFEVYIDTGNGFARLTDPTITTVDEEFARYEYTKSVTGNPKTYKVKISLATSNPLVRPRIRKLMSITRNV